MDLGRSMVHVTYHVSAIVAGSISPHLTHIMDSTHEQETDAADQGVDDG